MTTNYQRALDIADHIADVGESTHELVKQLHTAGLLMPDLPTPVRENCPIPGVFIETDDHGAAMCLCDEYGSPELDTMILLPRPDLKTVALYLLAAAGHTEGTKNEP